MQIGTLNRVIVTPLVSAPVPSQEGHTMVRQIVTAIQGLNKSELMGQNRSLAFIRDPSTRRPVIQIVDRETGDVIDQIPTEVVLRMMAELGSGSQAKRDS
jgi:uncharacterized FlaG/YvyC family protein